ncbi:MAG: hypothetical protein M1475_00435 [Actinobacteria bacterium]|nr:hypothetical protein [Actinomycetota bacterium]
MAIKTNKKIKIITLLSIFIIAFLLLFNLVSCGLTASTSSSGEAQGKDQKSSTSSNDNVQEEAVEAVKGEDLTDYDNVKVGAEIKGAIPGFLCTNKDNYVVIEVKNTSDFTWRNDSKNSVRAGYHYYGQDVDASDYDGTARTELEKNIAPGETAKINVLINDIKNPGNYVIQIDLVLEGKYWFSSKGVKMIESPAYFGECQN